jgi:single-strand DNA-binding protein
MSGIETAFSGRVGVPPAELKTSASGKAWAQFTVAVNTGEDEATWLKVAVFGERVEQLVGTLFKGDKVYCEGRLRLSTWTSKEGEPRSGLEVAAWRVDCQGQIGKNKPAKVKRVTARAPAAGDGDIPF